MNFTCENEIDDKLPFLDELVCREGDQLVTSIYRKPTFSGLYTIYNSYVPEKYKTGLINCLLFHIFTLTVDWAKFHEEVEFLNETFIKISIPRIF